MFGAIETVDAISEYSGTHRITIPSTVDDRMSTTYFKRFRMEIALDDQLPGPIAAPEGYELLAWDASLLDMHAKTKFLSFSNEIDAHVFPCFGELSGCRRLMRDISDKAGFMPEATWLAVSRGVDGSDEEYCGTIQGIRQTGGIGSIQNIGIVEGHRGRGLGTCLLFKALDGFRRAGLDRASLEVTAENEAAIRLYRRHGFHIAKTVYKAVEMSFV